ncbi:hypothetical protein PsYK624_131130 [Phanerochaete sordida]|uniref:Uncharacterized protein n=1 Tax=Phanerochaete sordida TaxID=48140 RepID=A0A9P3GKH9_9APHY|nr:hypothetical protein PsYK624_131130 [Phanerochaete sordida]
MSSPFQFSREYLEQIIAAQQAYTFHTQYSPHDPPNDFIPLYACRRRSSDPSLSTSTWGASPPSYDDLMRTVDARHVNQQPRFRSSVALSDILEEDDVEVIICDIVPPSPTSSTKSASTSSSLRLRGKIARSAISGKLLHIARSLRVKFQKRHPAAIVNNGTKAGLDLFDS